MRRLARELAHHDHADETQKARVFEPAERTRHDLGRRHRMRLP